MTKHRQRVESSFSFGPQSLQNHRFTQHVFLTGASGFIGSNLADRLLADGAQVTGWDNLSTGQIDFPDIAPAAAMCPAPNPASTTSIACSPPFDVAC